MYCPTSDEINTAVTIWCDEATANKAAYHGCRRSIPRLRRETIENRKLRRRLGHALIRRYRRDTGEVGGPRWDRFREWLHAHMDEVNFARLIVGILTLVIML